MVGQVTYNPLHGPRLAIAVILVCILAAFARGDDKADRDRAARVALALAGAAEKPKGAIGTAPAPRPKLLANYPDGYAKAASEEKPLVVFVGCAGHSTPGAIASHVEQFADVKAPAVVVGYPVGDRLFMHATMKCPVEAEQLDLAIKDAAKKINSPPAKAMPAPTPVDWMLRAEPVPAGTGKTSVCPCGDACKCAGACPSCPAEKTSQAKTSQVGRIEVVEPRLVGYRCMIVNGRKVCVPVYEP
jgi:hypothetical protein